MKKIQVTEYDSGTVGDGNITKTQKFYDDTNSYDTAYNYDYRNRKTDMRGPDNVATKWTFDHQSHTTKTRVYVDDNTDFEQNDLVTILAWNNISEDWDSQSVDISTGSGIDGGRSISIGDVNEDGKNDLVVAEYHNNSVLIIHWNTTYLTWDPYIIVEVGTDPEGAVIGDANNDGFNDIVSCNYADSNVSILLWNTSSKTWSPEITQSVCEYPADVFVGDANNDGKNDIVTCSSTCGNVSILLWNDSRGNWEPQITQMAGNEPVAVVIADANNDGANDIVTANQNGDDVSILLGHKTRAPIPGFALLFVLIGLASITTIALKKKNP